MRNPGFLEAIVSECRRRLQATSERVPLAQVEAAAARRHERRDFRGAIAGGSLRVIAEMKQASPSRGLLRSDYNPRKLAQAYEAGGAAALSVLTEEQFFRGSLTDLIDARDATGLPVLRKDFILDPYQVHESVAAGADALLVIAAVLSADELRSLIALAGDLRVAALVEVHTEAEVDRALAAGATLLGVNNRNLDTFEVDLEMSFRLRASIPASCLAVAESGIKMAADLRRLRDAGYNAVLVGEHLVTANDPGEALAAMLAEAEVRSQKPGARSQKLEGRIPRG